MGGRGSHSRFSFGNNQTNVKLKTETAESELAWQEAFSPGVDFQQTGDVDHYSRTVSRSLQQQWDSFTSSYQSGMTPSDDAVLTKDWDSRTNQLYGYIRTTNSFEINKKLYDPANAGKTDAQIFTRKDRRGNLRDLQTVQTLDRAISQHTTQANGVYTRFCSPNALKATFGLSDAQINALQNAVNLTPAGLKALNKVFAGKSSFSAAYTSTSANRSMNAFSNPRAPQSRGFIFERKIYTPQGTNAYAAHNNAQESEVIFGRRMKTSLMKITVSSDGHVVFHEKHDGYR